MKNQRKFFASLLAAALFLSLLPTAAASEIYGVEIRTREVPVASGVSVTTQAVWAPNSAVPRGENYLTYSPGGDVRPVVCYGDYLTGRKTLLQMAQELEERGLRVVGGINASFYDPDGCPIGVVVSGGRLLSADSDFYSVGFRSNGTAVLGRPSIVLTASWTTPERTVQDQEGGTAVIPARARDITVSGFNKVRSAGGYYLLSGEYAGGTRNTLDGVDVVLRPEGSGRGLPMGGSVSCEVAAVRTSLEDTSIPEGCLVLTVNSYSDAALLEPLKELAPGDRLTLNVTVDEAWRGVTEAVSGLYELIVDGKPNPALPADGRAPRTAVGLRADGSTVFYTIDGRQNGHSVGATYAEEAARLIELGCVAAVALDGGGSTSFGATFPEDEGFRIINQGSDGRARAVSTCLLLAEDAGLTGYLDSFLLKAADGPVLAGASIPLSVVPVDTAGRVLTSVEKDPYPWDDEGWSVDDLDEETEDGWDGDGWSVDDWDEDGGDGWPEEDGSGEDSSGSGDSEAGDGGDGGDAGNSGNSGSGNSGSAVNWSDVLFCTAELGSVAPDGKGGWIYTAPVTEENVLDTITVTDGEVTGTARLTVAGTPTSVRITDGGTGAELTELSLKTGAAVQLAASLRLYSWEVQGQDRLTWSVSPEVGTVDENGVLTAGSKSASGVLTVSAGAAARSIPVTVKADLPFVDIEGHWAAKKIIQLYESKIARGTVEADGKRYYHPDQQLSRQELAVFLIRLLGVDTAQYKDVQLPFVDADGIASWALPSVRAAYSLGLMKGSKGPDGRRINAASSITREEAMTIVGRALGVKEEADLSSFADGDTVSSWAVPHVKTLVARKIVQGSGGKLNPKAPISRAEAAKILCALLQS